MRSRPRDSVRVRTGVSVCEVLTAQLGLVQMFVVSYTGLPVPTPFWASGYLIPWNVPSES